MRLQKLFILFIALISISCERDDICAEATPTTPRLIIRFYDINNPETLKQVRQLVVDGLNIINAPNSDSPIVARTDTDSINLPLQFREENEDTTTRFRLKLNSDFDNNDDSTINSNSDVITVKYTPEFIYVSRACGYKSIFNLDDAVPFFRDGEPQGDANTWIRSFEIVNQTIDNENEAHNKIYH